MYVTHKQQFYVSLFTNTQNIMHIKLFYSMLQKYEIFLFSSDSMKIIFYFVSTFNRLSIHFMYTLYNVQLNIITRRSHGVPTII